MELPSIAEIVRKAEHDDELGQTTSSKYVTNSMRDDIDKTEAYLNSRHVSGDSDYMGREKPFFNIVIGARNIWYRATDLDRKNIRIRASKASDELKAFLATLLLQQWMKKNKFGQFLNEWGLSLSNHGSSIVEFVEKDNQLIPSVLNWNDTIVDAVDFDSNIKVKKLWFTPAQLRKNKTYDKALVKELLDSRATRTTSSGQRKDNKSEFIEAFEVHGELSLYYLTGKEADKDEYVQQIHVVSFQEKKNSKDQFDEYTLYKGREKNPHMITHLIKKDGQTYSGGAVKNLFEPQWMVNHSQKMIKDQLDLASKIVFQTADGAFAGQNVTTNIENGEILTHKENQPLTMLNNKPDIAAMQSFKGDWQNIANQINGISEAMAGINPPSGTAWRQTEAMLSESHDLFEMMTENKGLYLEEMLRRFVLPFIRKQLNNTDEIAAVLEDYQIKEIDARYIPNEAMRRVNKKKKQTILSGQIYQPEMEATDMQSAMQEIKGSLTGDQRFIKPSDIDSKTWKEVLDGLEWDLDIDITGEGEDAKSVLATLTTVFQTIVGAPGVLQDPNVRMVFNKILRLTGGISPLEISSTQQQMPQMPQMAGVPAPA